MFGHQIIEDFERLRKSRRDEKLLCQHMAGIITAIKQAQHFYVGDWHEVRKSFKHLTGRPLFDSMVEGARLPYPICWFDYHCTPLGIARVPSPKRGVIVQELGPDCIRAAVCNYLPANQSHHGQWFPSPLVYWIGIGKPVLGTRGGQALEEAMGALRDKWANCNIITGYAYDVSHILGPETPEMLEELKRSDWHDLSCLEASLLLLNCKNIGLERQEPPVALNRKRTKKGLQPLFDYHTLVLKPVGKHQESIPKHLWDNRIHLCRGHFKTYTEAKPLFGSIVGRFWWQPCVRGHKEKGVVLKDYELRTS